MGKNIEPFDVKTLATFSKPLCLEGLKGNYHSERCSNCLQCNSNSLWKNEEEKHGGYFLFIHCYIPHPTRNDFFAPQRGGDLYVPAPSHPLLIKTTCQRALKTPIIAVQNM